MTLTTQRALIDRALADSPTTREVVVRNGAIEQIGDVISRLYSGRTPVVVEDERTFGIAGRAVERSLSEAGLSASSWFKHRS